jgi:hypothetical protein
MKIKKIDDNCYFEEENIDNCSDLKQIDEKTQQLIFNKTIMLLKNTSRNMMQIIDDSEENWIVYNTLIEHKRIIDA